MEQSLEGALSAIQERNKKVEIQKAWETSLTRRAFIACMTYMVAYLYMRYGLEVARPHLDAFVPTGGYLLSTFGLPLVRDIWVRRKFGENP